MDAPGEREVQAAAFGVALQEPQLAVQAGEGAVLEEPELGFGVEAVGEAVAGASREAELVVGAVLPKGHDGRGHQLESALLVGLGGLQHPDVLRSSRERQAQAQARGHDSQR